MVETVIPAQLEPVILDVQLANPLPPEEVSVSRFATVTPASTLRAVVTAFNVNAELMVTVMLLLTAVLPNVSCAVTVNVHVPTTNEAPVVLITPLVETVIPAQLEPVILDVQLANPLPPVEPSVSRFATVTPASTLRAVVTVFSVSAELMVTVMVPLMYGVFAESCILMVTVHVPAC
jgi:hypothetical protein